MWTLLSYYSSKMNASIVKECLKHPGASDEELVNSSCHPKLLFSCQLDLPSIWPTKSCLNEAYVTQTCHSNRLTKVNASRPLPSHCATITACTIHLWEIPAEEKLEMIDSRKRQRGKWHCTSYRQTSWWWHCPGYWRPLRFAVLPWSGSQTSFCIWQRSTKYSYSDIPIIGVIDKIFLINIKFAHTLICFKFTVENIFYSRNGLIYDLRYKSWGFTRVLQGVRELIES